MDHELDKAIPVRSVEMRESGNRMVAEDKNKFGVGVFGQLPDSSVQERPGLNRVGEVFQGAGRAEKLHEEG